MSSSKDGLHNVAKACRALSGTHDSPIPAWVEMNSTVANTNIVWHGERLQALEEGHSPFEVDPVTLAPRGYFDFAGKLSGPMTAHPKFDASTGEMLFFGNAAKGRFTADVALHTVNAQGDLFRSQTMHGDWNYSLLPPRNKN